MIVRRLRIDDHQLLRELLAYVNEVQLPGLQLVPHEGDWRADIAGGVPLEDRPRPRSFRRLGLPTKRPIWMPPDAALASLNYYPPGGAGIGWHTDSTSIGWRVYIGRPLEGVPGEFMLPLATIADEAGFATAFHVSGQPCSSWHAVRAEGARLSVGIKITGDTARVLGLVS